MLRMSPGWTACCSAVILARAISTARTTTTRCSSQIQLTFPADGARRTARVRRAAEPNQKAVMAAPDSRTGTRSPTEFIDEPEAREGHQRRGSQRDDRRIPGVGRTHRGAGRERCPESARRGTHSHVARSECSGTRPDERGRRRRRAEDLQASASLRPLTDPARPIRAASGSRPRRSRANTTFEEAVKSLEPSTEGRRGSRHSQQRNADQAMRKGQRIKVLHTGRGRPRDEPRLGFLRDRVSISARVGATTQARVDFPSFSRGAVPPLHDLRADQVQRVSARGAPPTGLRGNPASRNARPTDPRAHALLPPRVEGRQIRSPTRSLREM